MDDSTGTKEKDILRQEVRKAYAGRAEGRGACCERADDTAAPEQAALKMGYSRDDVESVPETCGKMSSGTLRLPVPSPSSRKSGRAAKRADHPRRRFAAASGIQRIGNYRPTQTLRWRAVGVVWIWSASPNLDGANESRVRPSGSVMNGLPRSDPPSKLPAVGGIRRAIVYPATANYSS